MKNKDVKIGMKVVPFKKTAPGWGNLLSSVCWNKWGGKEQGFMYVTGLDEEGWMLNPNKSKTTGDFFRAGDFKPYEQPTRKARY